MGPLIERIALVAGATRGAGRGIALELAAAGALVYVTGRSSDSRSRPGGEGASAFDLAHRPETIEQTARLIEAQGGRAVALRVDHENEPEVRALLDRIEREQGRLDILVNDIWGGDALTQWGKPLWELDVSRGIELLSRALHTHLITSRHALPLLLRRGRGLIVEISDGVGMHYRGNAFYDLAKFSVYRSTFALAEELRERGITALAVSPGFLRSEAMLEHFRVSEQNWHEAVAKDPHFAFSETPRYVGRAIAALAAEPRVHDKSGRAYGSWQLQAEYGFTDVDGARPDWGAHAVQEAFGAEERASDARFRAMFG